MCCRQPMGRRSVLDMPEKFQKKMSQNRDQIMREGQCLNLGDGYYALNHKISTDFFDWNLITLTDANQQKLNNPMLVVIFIGNAWNGRSPSVGGFNCYITLSYKTDFDLQKRNVRNSE